LGVLKKNVSTICETLFNGNSESLSRGITSLTILGHCILTKIFSQEIMDEITAACPVIIAGAGLAGLTAALALTRLKIPVIVVDKVRPIL
jgi:NADPH-dependent 2,4-dienoyl-CoA reductase/sulfur reductase-like enzyme